MGALRKLSPSVISSVALHALLLLFWAITATQSHLSSAPKTSKYIMVEVDPLPKKQVVQTEKGTKTKVAAPDSYLGEQTQIVEKQTVSMPKTGTTAHVSQAEKSVEKKQPLITATGLLSKFGIAIGAGKEDSPKPKISNPMEEGSLTAQARGEYVKGFREGEQTMLNTREFVFYGYFQRIRERLDRAWEKSLRERLAKYFYRGRQLASETDYMTQLLVSLDGQGRIIKVQIVGASGTTDLDEAATKAFNDAGPFPNPPKGLVDNDGQVFVRWDFVLKT